MANSFVLAKNYIDDLDEVYKLASVTAGLSTPASMIRAGANVEEVVYPQLSTTGLGDYSRNSGYTTGNVTLKWQTTKCNYDRGTKLMVDTMDNQESFDLAFGMAGASLMREQVAPESDAFTFAQLAGTTGISTATAATYADASAFLAALIVAKNTMDEDEVPESDRHLFTTPTLLNSLMALDTTKSREAIQWFGSVVSVPQSRFYTAIDLNDGSTSGEENGGFKKATAGKDINFMIIHKPALIKFDKHVASDVIAPENNASHDAYILKYRKYGLVDVYKNKASGIYLSAKSA